MLVVSWRRWASAIVDSGREMDLPLRLLEGDVLYRDVFYASITVFSVLQFAALSLFEFIWYCKRAGSSFRSWCSLCAIGSLAGC